MSRLNIAEDAAGRQSLPMLPQPNQLYAVLSNCNLQVPLQPFATVKNSTAALMGSPAPSSLSMNYFATATMTYPAPLAVWHLLLQRLCIPSLPHLPLCQ